MEARPCQISEFFNGTKQLLVPLFQRPYEWGPTEWEMLWNDLLEQYERTDENAVASHFTGAIVTAPARSVPVGVSKHLVIDGQQRLTTIAVLLCSIRACLEPSTPGYRKLTRLLVNEDDADLDYFKLLPTQPDRAAFKGLVNELPLPNTRFTQSMEFFKKRLLGKDSDDNPIDLHKVVETIQNRLTVVSIHLGDTDDPYLIFESLNAKGAPLTQADLIRNYLLLRLHANEQQQAYELAWLPMQTLLLGDSLTEFMRQYLMQTGEEVARSAIYSVLKKRLFMVSDDAVANELHKMQKASVLYAHIVGLTAHNEETIASLLFRLRRWDVATANPFILKLLNLHSDNRTSRADVEACLTIIESFVVRRMICGVPTNQLKRIFLSLVKEMPSSQVAHWLMETLPIGSSGRRWPKDEEFRDALLRYRAYAQPIDRCKFLLETLESYYEHRERPTFVTATIEHILPQTLSSEWLASLGTDATAFQEKWLDLLCNLTLTAYNGELSNSAFSVKRKLLADSNFELNKWISERNEWTESELRQRSEILFNMAKKIWSRPNDETALNN